MYMTKAENRPILQRKRRRPFDIILKSAIYLCAGITVAFLAGMIIYIMIKGLPLVNWNFLSTKPSVLENNFGILPNIINTLYIIILTLLISTPIGVGAAIYLNEYAKKGRLTHAIEFTTETLAGIPSIIYGLFGFVFFSTILKLGYSILAGSFTLTIMILPILIRTTQEALKTVPQAYREGALGIGATRFYMIRTILLPSATPGIVTAVILSVGRIVGESAALIFTAGIGTVLPKLLENPLSLFTHTKSSGATLTVQLYQYMQRGDSEYAFAVAAVLIVIVFIINMITKAVSAKLKKA